MRSQVYWGKAIQLGSLPSGRGKFSEPIPHQSGVQLVEVYYSGTRVCTHEARATHVPNEDPRLSSTVPNFNRVAGALPGVAVDADAAGLVAVREANGNAVFKRPFGVLG